MTQSLTQLIERLEKADGDDFELDRDVGLATGQWIYLPEDYELNLKFPGARFMQAGEEIFNDNSGSIGGPSYTGDLNATIALVELMLPGWQIEILSAPRDNEWISFIAQPHWGDKENKISEAWEAQIKKLGPTRAPTPALALCIALLKALQAKEEAGA